MTGSELPANLPIFHAAQLEEVTDGEEEFIQELLDLYFEDAEGRLLTLAQAIKTGNREQARKEAHTFKGSSANIGAQRVAHIASQMEAHLNAGDPIDAIIRLEQQLHQEYELLEEFLEARQKNIALGI